MNKVPNVRDLGRLEDPARTSARRSFSDRKAGSTGSLPNIDKRVLVLLVIALTLIGAWLRFSSTGFGLPDQLRPDEEKLVPRALGFEEDWNPHLAIYPAAQTYLIHGTLRSYAILTGASRNLRTAYGSDNGAQAFLIARRISAGMGTATVPVIYLAVAPAFGSVAALVSAAIVAACYIHVRESKFAKVEVPAGLWLALSILMMLRITTRGLPMDYALAGFFCGLAAATHYTTGAISIGIVVAHLEARHRENQSMLASLADPRIYLAGFVTILTFSCTNPYFFLDWQQTVRDYTFLRDNFRMWNGGRTPAGFGWSWLLLRAMPAAFGIELEVFLLASMLWVIFRPRPGTFALLAFIVACFLSLTNGHPQLEFRYLVNPLLAMALLGGVFAADLTALACSRIGTRLGLLVAGSAGILMMTPSLIRDVQLNQLLHQTDTRTTARKWMIEHIPPASPVVLLGGHGYGKPKVPRMYISLSVHNLLSLKRVTRCAKWVVSDSFPPLSLWSQGATDAELAELNSEGTLEFDVDSMRPGTETPVFDPNDAFYVPFNHITSMVEPGPRIRIWKITASPGGSLFYPSSP
jgi:hypothetical protein